MDPYMYVLLHKYQQRDRLKQAEHERLLQKLDSTFRTQPRRLPNFVRRIRIWRTQRPVLRQEKPAVEF